PSLRNIGLVGAGAIGTVAVTLGAATVVGAQDDAPTLDDTSPEETREARQQARIDNMVEDGVITQEQADTLTEVREAVQAEREARKAERLEGIAGAIGITVDELEAAKESGQTLAEIAGDNLDGLVEYLTTEATAKIDEAVAEGRITQEQADEKLDGLSERIEQRIESGDCFGRKGHGRRGHHGPRNIDPTAAVPDQLLERLAENGVDTSGIENFEDLQELRESGALDDLELGRRGRGLGPRGGGFGPDAAVDAEAVAL
ncbi:MAG: hypothetical protein ACR2QO_14570, partial [Acidimicrobiales bacterium]